jgi:hypothetical protein
MKKVFILGAAFLLLARLFMMACKNIDTGNERNMIVSQTDTGNEKGEEMLPYNAIIGAGGTLRYKEDFLKVNRLYDVLYLNENGEWEWELDETLPKFRAFIITEKARLDEIFSVYPDIDFEKEMVVMYVYPGIYSREQKITSITLDNKNLKIEFKIPDGKPGYNNATAPQIHFLVLKMDKLEIDTVEFTLLNPRG